MFWYEYLSQLLQCTQYHHLSSFLAFNAMPLHYNAALLFPFKVDTLSAMQRALPGRCQHHLDSSSPAMIQTVF